MVRKFPNLERGMSASETGRDHIPPRVFKEMTRLNKQREKLDKMLSQVSMFNAKAKAAECAGTQGVMSIGRICEKKGHYSSRLNDGPVRSGR